MNEQSYYSIIPAPVMDADIPDSAKMFYGTLTSLSNRTGYCFAGNQFLAEKHRTTTRNVQRWIKVLVKHKFIAIRLNGDGNREILVLGDANRKLSTATTKMSRGGDKNVAYSNTVYKELKNYIDDKNVACASNKALELMKQWEEQYRKERSGNGLG